MQRRPGALPSQVTGITDLVPRFSQPRVVLSDSTTELERIATTDGAVVKLISRSICAERADVTLSCGTGRATK